MGLRSFRQMKKIKSRSSNLISYQTRIVNNLGFYSKDETLATSFIFLRDSLKESSDNSR